MKRRAFQRADMHAASFCVESVFVHIEESSSHNSAARCNPIAMNRENKLTMLMKSLVKNSLLSVVLQLVPMGGHTNNLLWAQPQFESTTGSI